MIKMDEPDLDDVKSKILLLKKHILKRDQLIREHAQLQADNEALIKGYKVIEDKEKETAKRLQKYVKGCGRLLKENESQKKEIASLKEAVDEKINSMEMLRLENERLNGALKMFQEERKFLHQSVNCTYRNDRTYLIKLCYEVFKNRLKTEKISNLYKNFRKKYEADEDVLKLKVLKIEKMQKGRNIKSGGFDSDLDESVNDFSEEFQPIDSVESGYHENDSIIESIQSKSDCKLDQDFDIQEGISLSENSNERWLDPSLEGNDFTLDIPIDNNLVDIKASCVNSVPNVTEEGRGVMERPITPPNAIIPSGLSFSPDFPCGKEGSISENKLEPGNPPVAVSPNQDYYSLYISPVKERLMGSPDRVEKSLPIGDKPKPQDVSPVARSLSFSPDSSPVKVISISCNNLKTYGKKRKVEVEKSEEETSDIEILGKQIEINIMGENEGQVEEQLVDVEGMQMAVEEKEVEEEPKQVEQEDTLMEMEGKHTEVEGKQEEEVEKQIEEKDKSIEVEKKQAEVGEKEIQEGDTSDDEMSKILNEMKMPTLLSPLSITPEEFNSEIKKVKSEKKNKKAKKKKRAKKKVEEDEGEWRDALYAALSLKKKDKTAKAILDLLKKSKEEKVKRKKALKKKKSSWAVEDFQEEKFSEDEKDKENFSNERSNYVSLINVSEVSEKSGKGNNSEMGSKDLENDLNEISTQTEVEISHPKLPEHHLVELFQSEEPKILLNEICTQTEGDVGLPELPGNCVEDFLEREECQNDRNCSYENSGEISMDLSIKSYSDEHSKNYFEGNFEMSEQGFSQERQELCDGEKSEVNGHDQTENSIEIVLDLSQKNSMDKISDDEAFENAPNESPESPTNYFLSEISENEALEDFFQNPVEACLNETPESPPDPEKGLLESSGNNTLGDYSENEELENSPEKCLTESPDSPEEPDKGLEECLEENLGNHLFSENSSYDSEENRLKIVSDELSEKSSEKSPSPSVSIKFDVPLVSPMRAHNYQLRSSSLSPSSPPEPPFPRIKFIDTSPFDTYYLAFRNYYLNSCDINDSDSGLPEKNSPEHSPITRNIRQRCKRKRKRRTMEDDLDSSSETETEARSELVQEGEDKTRRNLFGSPQSKSPIPEDMVDSVCKSLIAITENRDSVSEPEEEASEVSDSVLGVTREHSPITRNTRRRHKNQRKRRRIDDDSDSSSEADANDVKRKSFSELIQERENKAARKLMESPKPEAQTPDELEMSMLASPIAVTRSRESISTADEETSEIRQNRSLAEIRSSVLRATRNSNTFEELTGSNPKRRRIESAKPVEVCGTCFGQCFNRCKRKLKVTDEVQKRLLQNMVHKETKPHSDLQIDIAPEVAMSSGSDTENKKRKEPEEPKTADKSFELDSILMGMTKQKEEFKAPPRRVAVLVPVFEQVPGMPKMQVPIMQAPGMPSPGICHQRASEVNIDWSSIYDNINIESFNSAPNEKGKVDEKEPVPEERTRNKLKLTGKRLSDFVKKKLERFAMLDITNNEEAGKYAKECISYLINVPENVIVKEIVELVLENIDEELIQFEKPAPPLTKTQQRLFILISLLQKSSSEFKNLSSCTLKLISQKIFPERFFWPDDSLESASRFYTALCKNENNFKSIWKFCFTALSEMHQRFSIVIYTVLLVWPDILHDAELIKSNLLTTTFVQLILQTPKCEGRKRELQAQQRKLLALKELLRLFYHFEVKNTLDGYLKELLNEFLKGTEKSEESLNLFVKSKTFEWLSAYFVPKISEHLNSWAERKIGSDIGIKFLNFLKLISNKVPVAKNLNAKFSKLVTCLAEILSSGKMNHGEEEEIVEVLISFPKYIRIGDVLAVWNAKSGISQNLQEKISKAVKDAQKPARTKPPQKPKPKVEKNVNSKREFNGNTKKRGGRKHKKKKSGITESN